MCRTLRSLSGQTTSCVCCLRQERVRKQPVVNRQAGRGRPADDCRNWCARDTQREDMAMASNKGSILIVDDEDEVRDTLREYFESCGFDVYVASDGDSMRKVVGQRKVDIVLMDLNLPGEDGLALTRQLRSSHRIGIIMLTAAGQTVDRIRG